MKAHAFWTVAPGVGALREEDLPVPGPEQVLVRTLVSGISRGTERLVFHGRVPASQYDAMRAPLQAGEFPFPVKYGYAAVGIAETGPPGLHGHRVFCLHPHQDRFVAPAAMCVPVPDAVPDARAALAANMETAVNLIWDARPLPGERALVIGAGTVGLLAGYLLARMPAVAVTICDIDAGRAALARRLGAAFCLPEAAPADCDLIVHASADPDGLRLALDRAAFEARILEASWYGDRPVTLPLGEAFHARRLSIIASQVGSVSPAMRGRRSTTQRLALALSLLEDSRFDALVGPATAFADLPAAMPALLAPAPPSRSTAVQSPPPCPIVTYP
ncbi:zinc-binding alcohol dehydrogenase [Roseomonas sp. NAR14]|uniref:Zinc-binding alcohol dehydrogenase n=1 Tax=Roseomonas acroporae TaxID=2937791 RepID=A0A9X2BVX0_9PROT|nr:zinc-binding alcohol dehydrogenase [Roseomonas acroporae]MCK8783180.1 zinc-binding alcohol dehydrogenase [Roseomonas acroporae]